jgi:hypothetical protein
MVVLISYVATKSFPTFVNRLDGRFQASNPEWSSPSRHLITDSSATTISLLGYDEAILFSSNSSLLVSLRWQY